MIDLKRSKFPCRDERAADFAESGERESGATIEPGQVQADTYTQETTAKGTTKFANLIQSFIDLLSSYDDKQYSLGKIVGSVTIVGAFALYR